MKGTSRAKIYLQTKGKFRRFVGNNEAHFHPKSTLAQGITSSLGDDNHASVFTRGSRLHVVYSQNAVMAIEGAT